MKKSIRRQKENSRRFSGGKEPFGFLKILISLCLILSFGIFAAGCGPAADDGSAEEGTDPEKALTAEQVRAWFDSAVAKNMSDEKVESLRDQMLSVIGESQTKDGVTLTLNAAMRDDRRVLMSFTVEGKELQPDIGSLDKSSSWMETPLTKEALKSQMPDLDDEEIEAYLTERKAQIEKGDPWVTADLSLDSFKADDGSQGLLVQRDWSSDAPEEITVHLEKFGGIEGPFEFKVNLPVKGEPVEYTGDLSFTAAGGREMTLTKVCIYPMSGISAEIRGKDGSLPAPEADSEFQKSTDISAVLWNDIEAYGKGKGRNTEEDRIIVSMQDFYGKVITPEDVTAIKIGDTWFELRKMKKTGDA